MVVDSRFVKRCCCRLLRYDAVYICVNNALPPLSSEYAKKSGLLWEWRQQSPPKCCYVDNNGATKRLVQVSPKTKVIFRYVISGFLALLGYYSLRKVPEERSSQYSESLRAHEVAHKRSLKDVCKEKSVVTNSNQMKKEEILWMHRSCLSCLLRCNSRSSRWPLLLYSNLQYVIF